MSPASATKRATSNGAPSQIPWPSRPSIVVSPEADRNEANVVSRAWRASGAAPPNEPEWAGWAIVVTVMRTDPVPRSEVVSVGWPAAMLPVSTSTIASAATRSGWERASASIPPDVCSSEPSHTTATVTGQAPRTAVIARSASTVAMRLPLQSAAPRPNQRPSRSVRSNGGESQASSAPAGTTSWWV